MRGSTAPVRRHDLPAFDEFSRPYCGWDRHGFSYHLDSACERERSQAEKASAAIDDRCGCCSSGGDVHYVETPGRPRAPVSYAPFVDPLSDEFVVALKSRCDRGGLRCQPGAIRTSRPARLHDLGWPSCRLTRPSRRSSQLRRPLRPCSRWRCGRGGHTTRTTLSAPA